MRIFSLYRRRVKLCGVFILILTSLFTILEPSFAADSPGEGFDIEKKLKEMSSADRRGGIVLVLSGGGTKGFAHVGVLEVLERENIPIVGIVGTSIGSVIGGLYATGYTAHELHEIIMDTNIMGLLADSGTRIKPGAGDHRPVGESVKLFKTQRGKDFRPAGPLGVLQAMSLVSFLTKYTGHIQTTDFMDLPVPFACVATDIGNGDTVVLKDGSLPSAIRASVAIPGLLEPWPMEGRLLVDGGLVANLPVKIAKELFPGYPVLAVNLSGTSIAKPIDNFSSFVDILVQTIDVMTVDKIKENADEADFVLYPDVTGLSMLDATGYDTIFERGMKVAEDNLGKIVALSQAAPPPPVPQRQEELVRIVRGIQVQGLQRSAAEEIEKYYSKWVGQPYDVAKVNAAMDLLAKREEIATVDVDIYPASPDNDDINLVFSVEKRSPYEITVDGYTSNLHHRRWLGLTLTGRDLMGEGDSGSVEGRWGNEEWGVRTRYFTPLIDQRQWGFALSGGKEKVRPEGLDNYTLDRFSGRIMYYKEGIDRRLGFGVAGERTNATGKDDFVWGPYLYYTRDTLDDALMPTSGHSFTSQIWWNTGDILVSRSNLTAYIPLKSEMHLVFNLGLKTGDKDHQAYRALLGDQEELFSLGRRPYAGDQAAWGHVGLGYNFYTSWWGALRGEIFGAYGMVMDDWSRSRDAWEAGFAFSVPGQFFNGRLLIVYDDDGEVTLGFTIGAPRWWSSPLP